MKFLLNPFTLLELIRRKNFSSYSEKQLATYQLRSFQKIVIHAYENIPFYREKYDLAGFKPNMLQSFEDIKRVPILTKPELRNFSQTFQSANLNKYFVDVTSGSTNVPMKLYRTVQEKAYLNSKFLFAMFQIGYRVSDRTFSIGVPARVVKRDSIVQKLNLLSRFNIGFDKPVEEIAKQFCRFQPDVLYAYKSQLLRLGNYLKQNNTSFVKPRITIVAGEIVDPISAEQLKELFGSNIYYIYGSVEFNNMAFQQIPNGSYTINHSCNLIEQTAIVKDGIAEFLLTDFYLRAMPLIRYQIGDGGIMNESSGLKSIVSIQSKIDNFVITTIGKIYDFELIALVSEFNAIKKFQLKQKSMDHFELIVVSSNSTLNIHSIETNLRKHFVGLLIFEVRIVVDILPESNGKLRLIVPLIELKE